VSVVNIKSNDQEIIFFPPQTDTDARVPTAEELGASAHLQTRNLAKTAQQVKPAGVLNRPVFGATPTRSITIPADLKYYAPGHPSLEVLPSSATVQLPALGDNSSSISRYDQVYLVCFAAEVTEDIDPDIRFQFRWRAQNNSLQTLLKENTRRHRSFWAIAISQTTITPGSFVANLPALADGSPSITVNSANAGVSIGAYQLYAKDPNLVNTKTYRVVLDSVVLIPLLRVWRVQNFLQSGFRWGLSGEAEFSADYHLQPNYQYVGPGFADIGARALDTLWRVFQGKPLPNSPTADRAVWNFVNGQVGGNPSAPGVATPSPNGSTALANTQRITFTNQAIVQKIYCKPVIATAIGPNSRLVVDFIENSPEGAQFSNLASDHKVFNASGQDVTSQGTFTGLGDTGALIWEGATAAVAVGATAYVVPGIFYPSGSGFPQHGTLEQVYLNGLALNPANIYQNIYQGGPDIQSFVIPAGGEEHLIIYNPQRAAIEKIYKKLSIISDGAGVVRLPSTARGLIAFISGANAPILRQDKAVITSLTPNQPYTVLVYHAPPPTEQWQFQFLLTRYKGTQNKSLLNGAKVASKPIAYAHNLGGGGTTPAADGSLRGAPIALLLPQNLNQTSYQPYQLTSPIQFVGEPETIRSLREVELFETAYSALKVGQLLVAEDLQDIQLQSMPVRLRDGDGVPLGVSKSPLASAKAYQLVAAAAIEKNGESALLVVTQNNGNPSELTSVSYQSTGPDCAAIDVFNLY
jgi:hypothetical protein